MEDANRKEPIGSQKAGLGRRGFLAKASLIGAGVAVASFSSASAQPAETRQRAASAQLPSRRKLGTLEVSSLGLGAQNMSRKYNSETPYRPEMIALIRAAHDQGVTFFDTAEAYGPFECERILGESIASFRKEVVVTTKFGWDIDPDTGKMKGGLNSRPQHIKRAVEGSLQRLRTDHVDLVYQHRVDPPGSD